MVWDMARERGDKIFLSRHLVLMLGAVMPFLHRTAPIMHTDGKNMWPWLRPSSPLCRRLCRALGCRRWSGAVGRRQLPHAAVGPALFMAQFGPACSDRSRSGQHKHDDDDRAYSYMHHRPSMADISNQAAPDPPNPLVPVARVFGPLPTSGHLHESKPPPGDGRRRPGCPPNGGVPPPGEGRPNVLRGLLVSTSRFRIPLASSHNYIYILPCAAPGQQGWGHGLPAEHPPAAPFGTRKGRPKF